MKRGVISPVAAVLALLALLAVAPAGASAILPGFDLFETQSGATVDLTVLHPSCPSAVPLVGVPLLPSLGNADTLVERIAGSGSPFDPPGDAVTVPIELVALHLVSVAPVDTTCFAGPGPADLHLIINKGGVITGLPVPGALAPSLGSMAIRHDLGPGAGDDFGGGFDSCFGEAAEAGHSPPCDTLGVAGGGVFALTAFVTPGGDPASAFATAPAPKVALSSTAGTWLHVPAPGYPLDPSFPAGAFFVQTLPHVGPHPVEPAKLVTATKVDSLADVGGTSGDVDADGVADPGDTVSYTVEITGLGDAADVTFEDTVDPNSTLVPGSVQVTPIAFDDAYDLTGTTLTVPAATGVLLNDIDPDHSTMPGTNTDLTAVSLDVTGTAGTVSNFMPDGSFDYETAMGFTGLDSFQYTARDEDTLDSVTTGVVVIDVKNTAPTATDDSYKTLGNTLLEVALTTASGAPAVVGEDPTPAVYANVLANDTDTETPAGLTAAVVGASVTAGAVVVMNADGSFSYTPPVDFTGTDTFDYTVTDPGGLDDTGTVSVMVANMIWFVDDITGSDVTGDGRSNNPFASLGPLDAGGSADAADGSGDTIFVFADDGETTGGILLETNQVLHGNEIALDFPGLSYAAGSVLVASSTAPKITDAAGDVVELASGNTVRGLDIAATNGRAIFGNATAGATLAEVGTTGSGSGTGIRFDAATGTIAISNLDVASSTDSGIDIQGGTATFTFDSLSSITNTAAPAFNVNGGTAQVTYSGSITQGNNFPAVSITGHGNGAGTGITFQTGAISATNGSGLQFSNADGNYNFNGATTLNGGGTNDTGIDILGGSAGTFTFANTSITNPSGAGLNIDGSTAAVTWSGGAGISKNNAGAAVNVNNHSTGAVNIGVDVNASGAGAGTGLQFSNADGTYNFNTMTGTTTLNGGDAGIDIVSNSNGTFTFGSNTTITNPSGIAFNLDASTDGNITYNGTVSKTNVASAASAVRINQKTGGSVSFTGSITGNTATASAINLTSNAGGSFTFSGLLDLDTTSGIGFNATGGGTVQATNAGNTVTTVGDGIGFGVGVSIGAGIGALGVTFNSVDVGSSGKAGTGIGLANTGNLGTFTVTGGTIQNTNNRGFDAANVDGTVSIGADIQNDGGRSVEITGSEGQFTFSGAIDEDAQGINISSNNTGSPTFTFKGGLDVDTFFGNNIGLRAFSGGTLQICADTNCDGTGTALVNTIDTTGGTGTGISIDAVTIGTAGVTFRSIDVDAGGTATSGIVLDTTGAGTFTVTGVDGPCGNVDLTMVTLDCDGGTIENVAGADAIKLEATGGRVTLANMLIEDITDMNDSSDAIGTRAGHDGIHGQAVDGGLTLDSVLIRKISDNGVNGALFSDGISPTTFGGLTIVDSWIEDTNRFHVGPSGPTGRGDDADEGGVRIDGLTGTVLVTGSLFQRGASGLDLISQTGAGTLDITIQGNTFKDLYKEFLCALVPGTTNVGRRGITIEAEGAHNVIARIGDPAELDDALGNTFTNNLAASIVVVGQQGGGTAHTGKIETVISRNDFVVTDHLTGPPGCLAGTLTFNHPQGGVSLNPAAGSTYEAIVSHNLFDQVMHAAGGLGQLTLGLNGGVSDIIVRNNEFKLPWDHAVQVRAEGTSVGTEVLFENNTWTDGTVGGPGDDVGVAADSPFIAFTVNVLKGSLASGGKLDLTIRNEGLPQHDTVFSPGDRKHTLEVEVQSDDAGNLLNLHMANNSAPEGYHFKEFAGDFNLFRGVSSVAAGSTCAVANPETGNCRTVLDDNGNTGSPSGTEATSPPFIRVEGAAIDIIGTAPTIPTPTIP